MPKALPPQPHIDWLKKAAKEQLAALRMHDASAKLHQAQLAVANDYGFQSWRALKARVDTLSLDGQIIAAVKEGRARDLDKLLAQHPRKIDTLSLGGPGPSLFTRRRGGCGAAVEREANERAD